MGQQSTIACFTEPWQSSLTSKLWQVERSLIRFARRFDSAHALLKNLFCKCFSYHASSSIINLFSTILLRNWILWRKFCVLSFHDTATHFQKKLKVKLKNRHIAEYLCKNIMRAQWSITVLQPNIDWLIINQMVKTWLAKPLCNSLMLSAPFINISLLKFFERFAKSLTMKSQI